MCHIPWENRLDAVINVFTAFGYFDDEVENQQVLEGVHRALQPGGRFLVDLPDRDRRAQLSEGCIWFEVGETLVWTEFGFDPVHSVSHDRGYWMENGERRSLEFSVRPYTPTDMKDMLLRAGLHWRAGYGDWKGGELTPDIYRITTVTEREE